MPPTLFREILVLVAGSTPQIITETIQALVCQSPPIIPDCIRIITTVPGKQLILDKLVTGGILSALCREYEIPGTKLNRKGTGGKTGDHYANF